MLRFHGGAYDRAAAIVADGSGNSYVGGSVESRDGASSFAVVKLGPDGATRWTARYDGSRGGVGGQANAVAVDAAGNVYAAGYTGDGVMFNTNYDYLVVKFGPDGTQRCPSVPARRACSSAKSAARSAVWQRRRLRRDSARR